MCYTEQPWRNTQMKIEMDPKGPKFALCIKNDDCEDLEIRKIYQVLLDTNAAKDGYLRVVDESGDDYLYPQSSFVLLELPRKAQEVLSISNK